MDTKIFYLIAADAILLVHIGLVLFNVFGLLLVFAGGVLSWSWVRNPWFRLVHLACIGIVVLQSWIGIICPFTDWEMTLRQKAGDAVYTGSFIAHWLGEMLYFSAPPWVFTACYTVFGLLVIAAWVLVRPRAIFKSRKSY